MAIDLFRGFSNPISGESFRCIAYSEEAFIFEFEVKPLGGVPFEHIHLFQDEAFHVKSGEIKILIDGKEFIGKAGETIIVPRGCAHIASNNKMEVLKCVVEYRPGLDNYKFFQCFAGLTLDNDIDGKGEINIPKMLYFTKLMNARCLTRPTNIPYPVFKLAINFFYLVGSILGWKRFFKRYTQ